MFTGIVTDIGDVLSVKARADDLHRLKIACGYPRLGIADGASIAWGDKISNVFLRRPNTLHGAWVLAYEAPQRVWHVQVRGEDYKLKSEVILRAPTGTAVVGLDAGARLFLLDGERKELSLVKRSSNQILLKSSSPLVDVRVASGGPIAAYVTQSGELGALDFSGQIRLRRSVGEP